MPRRDRLMDYLARRDMARGRDGRNPYGSRGGYVDTERGMDYARNDYNQYDSRRGDRAYSQQDYARGRRDYEPTGQYDMARRDYNVMSGDYARGRDRASDYDYEGEDFARGRSGRDGHYPMREGGSTYYPIEAMGRFNGYYGMDGDMARGNRRDYGYDYSADYGETLSKKEIEKWNKKLMKEVEEKDKQFFSKENISRKAQQMGIKFDKYKEDELAVASAMMYTDYCMALKPFVGANMDVYVKLADAFLNDKDASVKGGEKLAIYHDCIVEDEEDD